MAGEKDLLPDGVGVGAVLANDPASVDEHLVNEAAPRGQLVELEVAATCWPSLRSWASSAAEVLRNLLGKSALLPLLFETSQDGFVFGLGETKLLECLASLAIRGQVGWRRLVDRTSGAATALNLDEEPLRDLEGLMQTLERKMARDRLTRVRGPVACFADSVELLEDDLGNGAARNSCDVMRSLRLSEYPERRRIPRRSR